VNCFKKVDEETDQIAPEAIKTTVVVAVVSSSHIIVATFSWGKWVIPLVTP
jgi:hypothetical protein